MIGTDGRTYASVVEYQGHLRDALPESYLASNDFRHYLELLKKVEVGTITIDEAQQVPPATLASGGVLPVLQVGPLDHRGLFEFGWPTARGGHMPINLAKAFNLGADDPDGWKTAAMFALAVIACTFGIFLIIPGLFLMLDGPGYLIEHTCNVATGDNNKKLPTLSGAGLWQWYLLPRWSLSSTACR